MAGSTRDQSVFNAIADPTRREILGVLAAQPAAVEEIAARFPVTRPAISKHLKALLEAGLVYREPAGRKNIYRIEPDALATVRDWVNGIWGERLRLLKRLAEGDS